jgi:hypothetical protein
VRTFALALTLAAMSAPAAAQQSPARRIIVDASEVPPCISKPPAPSVSVVVTRQTPSVKTSVDLEQSFVARIPASLEAPPLK